MKEKSKNKTIKLNDKSLQKYKKLIVKFKSYINFKFENIINKTINCDSLEVLKKIPSAVIDLIILDPPYNLRKKYNTNIFNEKKVINYEKWLKIWLIQCHRILKKTGTIYVCADWKSSVSIYKVLSEYFHIHNRITWSRDKGRGSKKNWKNNIEDIYFATKSKKNYYFNSDNVKIKRKVLAPYKDKNKNNKDWFFEKGHQYRLTHHPNIWDDLVIPFWSMNENTEHPTQKPEKLIAKLILASSQKNDIVFDPFLGSGTTSVVASKLERKYIGIEIDEKFSLIAEKRIALARKDKKIQGYNGEYFLGKGIK